MEISQENQPKTKHSFLLFFLEDYRLSRSCNLFRPRGFSSLATESCQEWINVLHDIFLNTTICIHTNNYSIRISANCTHILHLGLFRVAIHPLFRLLATPSDQDLPVRTTAQSVQADIFWTHQHNRSKYHRLVKNTFLALVLLAGNQLYELSCHRCRWLGCPKKNIVIFAITNELSMQCSLDMKTKFACPQDQH